MPRKEVDKIDRKNEEQQKYKRINKLMEGHNFGQKIPSKNIIKRNTHGGAAAPPTCIRNNNRCSIFEDAEEDTEEDDYKCVKTDKQSDEMKTKISFDAEKISTIDIEENMRRHNEKNPEGSSGAGAFKYVSVLETKIAEKEIENHKSQYCSVEALQFISQSQLSCNAKCITKKHRESKMQCDKKSKEYHNMVHEYKILRLTNRENA